MEKDSHCAPKPKWLNHAHQQCQKNGVRLTEKRTRLLALLHHAHQPLSAYELVRLYQETYDEEIKPMSAYRMLDTLIQAGLAHRLETTNNFVACHDDHHDCKQHGVQFFICDQCQTVIETPISEAMHKALTQQAGKSGFTVSPQLELHGTCSKCTKQSPQP